MASTSTDLLAGPPRCARSIQLLTCRSGFTTLLTKRFKHCPPLNRSIKCDVLIAGGGMSGISKGRMRRTKPGKQQRQRRRRPSTRHCLSCLDPPCLSLSLSLSLSGQALRRAFLAVSVTFCVQCSGNLNGTSTYRSAAPSARPGGSAGNSWARKDAIRLSSPCAGF